ncbi:hypothetical protein ACG7TL_003526 [Trametes sanguinea]
MNARARAPVLPHRLIPVPVPRQKARDVFARYIRAEHLADFQHMKLYTRSIIEEQLDKKLIWTRQDKQAVEGLVADRHAAANSSMGEEEEVSTSRSRCPMVRPASAALPRKDTANRDRYAISRASEATSGVGIVVMGQLTGGEQDVLGFLIGVDRSLASLFDRFRYAGITSRDRLEHVARWTPEEREMFMLRELRVSAYEQKLNDPGNHGSSLACQLPSTYFRENLARSYGPHGKFKLQHQNANGPSVLVVSAILHHFLHDLRDGLVEVLSIHTFHMQAYPPAHPRGLVPEPKYHARDVFPNLLRPEDRKHFTQMKTFMRTLLENRLDTDLTWACQDSQEVHRLVSDVSEERYPMFRKYYQNNWPVRTYACRAFHSVRQRRQKGIQKITRAHWPTATNENEVLDLEDEGRTGKKDAADGGGTLTPQKANSPATKTARVAVTGPLAGGEQDVLEFLVAADRSFASLLERFRLAGLTSRARLEALAKWAREERDMFLVRELRLSAFEQKLVNDALARFPKSMA